MGFRLSILLLAVLTLASCAKKTSVWDGNYGRVYERAGENDSSYTAPSVAGCVDDDLFNCK